MTNWTLLTGTSKPMDQTLKKIFTFNSIIMLICLICTESFKWRCQLCAPISEDQLFKQCFSCFYCFLLLSVRSDEFKASFIWLLWLFVTHREQPMALNPLLILDYLQNHRDPPETNLESMIFIFCPTCVGRCIIRLKTQHQSVKNKEKLLQFFL